MSVSTGAGLALLAIYALTALVGRSVLHRRRHGDSGSRLTATTTWGKVAAAVMSAAHTLALIGVLTADSMTRSGLAISGALTFAAGLAVVVCSQAAMGASWRVGVDPTETTALVTAGPFGVVRNPIFTGMVLCLTGVALAAGSLVAATATGLFIAGVEIQVRLVEEPHLRSAHGANFNAYATRVGRFVPGIGTTRLDR